MAEQILALVLLFAGSVAAGAVARRLGMPPLVGMLLAGVGLRNLATGLAEVPESWSVGLRLVALTVILLRAGLGLDLEALSRLRGAVLRLSFVPNLAEAVTVAVMAAVLFDFPVAWGLLLGFVVAAVSPAVVVPGLLDLQNRGYGVAKGIPTMVLAAASFDDVVAITGFGLAASLIFAGGGDPAFVAILVRAPLELGLGLGLGIAGGLACGLFRRSPLWLRFGTLTGCGLGAVLGGWAVGFTGGGSLAAITIGATAARQWDIETVPVALWLGRVWSVAQPVLFGLIGAAVALSAIEPSYVTSGLVILAAGLAVRVAAAFGSVATPDFVKKERMFVALAWIPKATVQAAIGGLALDLARAQGSDPVFEIYGTQVLTVAVLAILATAPFGAIAIARTGPRWLEQSPPSRPTTD